MTSRSWVFALAILCVVTGAMSGAPGQSAGQLADEPAGNAALEPAAELSAARYQARLAGHMSQARLGQALALGAEAVSRHPGDAQLHYLYGLALRMSLQMEPAAAQLERARELSPHDPAIAIALARTHAARGQLERAEAVARQAAGDRDAAALAEMLATEQRIRAGAPVALEPGSAAAVAHDFLADIAAGGLARALARHVAPDAIDRVIHAISGPRQPGSEPTSDDVSEEDRRRFIDSTAAILTRAWDNEFGGPGNRYVGYEVHAGEPADSGDVIALGTMLMIRDYSALSAGALGERLAGDGAAGVDPEAVLAYRGLDAGQRGDFLARLATTRRSIHVPLAVRLRMDTDMDMDMDTDTDMERAGAWRVRDLWFGDPPVYVSALAERSWSLAGNAPEQRDFVANLAWATAKLVGLVVLLAAFIFTLRRKLRG